MQISVIIPSYKPGNYIWECLDSLVNQSLSKTLYEVLIILNGCKSPWYDNLYRYCKLHSDVNFHLYQTNIAGVSNARNIGIEKSIGEYIAFIDDDDYVSNSYLEELYKCASINTVSLSCPYAFYDGNRTQLKYKKTEDFIKNKGLRYQSYNGARRFFSGPCMKLIHRDIINSRKFDIRLKNGEDTLFMFLISDKIKYVAYTSDNAIYYRRFRENSAYMNKISCLKNIRNISIMVSEYIKIYHRNFPRYNFIFYLTRLAGALKNLIIK